MAASSSAGKPDRLFVGNLAPTVDEYTLVQVFSKHGKITKLDIMYHKTGPQKGKPRGYAFVEYASKDDALKALVKLHDRVLRGRKLVVTYANAAPQEESMFPKSRRVGEAGKPTTLSLLKSQRRPQSAAAQIAAMEAKLAELAQRPGRSPTPEDPAIGEANALEAEFMAEFKAGPSHSKRDDTPAESEQAPQASAPVSDAPSTAPSLPTSEPASAIVSGAASPALPADQPVASASSTLPSRPAATAAPKRQDDQTTARQLSFQRGLAGLPKKPTFSTF